MGTPVKAEIEGSKVRLDFRYDYDTVNKVKAVPGRKFVPEDKGGPYWTIPLELESLKQLAALLGKMMLVGPQLKAWGQRTQAQRTELRTLATAASAELVRLPTVNRKLAEAIHLGPLGRDMKPAQRKAGLLEPPSFQAADTRFTALSPNPMICNHPGTGKTLIAIAGVYECGMESGPKLVIAPKTSLESVWMDELQHWTDQEVLVCPEGRNNRVALLEYAHELAEAGKDFWFVCNFQMLQFQVTRVVDEDNNWLRDEQVPKYPYIHDIQWSVVILDEFHKSGITNTQTVTAQGLKELKAAKRIGLSGTPIGGKPIKLFGILQWLNPEQFTSKWRWADQWLEVETNRFGKQIGDIRKGREDAFYEHIAPYMVRRTKAEVLPWLPPKQHIEMYCEMGPAQEKQYRAMAEEAEARIDGEETITATGILAEYTRLKQFADALSTLGPYIDKAGTKRKVIPTEESCKLPVLEQILDERGVFDDDLKDSEVEQVVVFSQFSEMADMVYRWLDKKGVHVAKITGAVSGKDRTEVQRNFREHTSDGPRVLCMTTTAGGVSINLDSASTVVFLDETWNPDDQEQAEDRCHRASRIHQVTVYKIVSKNSIEEYIKKKLSAKDDINKKILDLRRAGFRAV